jgi:tetratricopeptide (TPR) repeat protein
MAEMEAAARVGREHARRAGNVPVERIATERLLTALDYSGAPRSQVIEIAQEELERDRLGRAFRVRALITLGRCYASQGRLDEGAALLDESGRIYAELGNEVHAAAQLQHRAFVEWLRGDWSATEALARESWDRLGALGEVGYRSTSGAVLGVALARLERDAEAEETLRLAEEMSSPDDYVTELWVLIGRTTLALNAGEHALAVRRARAAVELSATRDDSFHLIIARIVLAEALVAAGETEEARGVVDEAVSLAERQESPGYADRARSVLATMAS